MKDFTNVFKAHRCEKLFGIDTLADRDWSKMSVGNASVVLPSSGDNYDKNAFVPVGFAFNEDKGGFAVHGNVATASTSTPVGPGRQIVGHPHDFSLRYS